MGILGRFARAARSFAGGESRHDEGARQEGTAGEGERRPLLAELPKMLAEIEASLDKRPAETESLRRKARVLAQWGRRLEAEAVVAGSDPGAWRDPETALWLAENALELGRTKTAEARLRTVIEAAPDRFDAWRSLGRVLLIQGRPAEARQAFDQALLLDPADVSAQTARGVAFLQEGRTADAAASLRSTVEHHPDAENALDVLGVALAKLGQFDEAKQCFASLGALSELRGDGSRYLNHAIFLRDVGDLTGAIELHERWLPDLQSVDGHYEYALALLAAGRMEPGWQEYEFRWLREPLRSRRALLPVPLWNGQAIAGKTILLVAEQGLGDTIQFIRYAFGLKALGATLILRAQPGLERLCRRCKAVDRVLDKGEPVPAIDFYVYLMSLPRLSTTELQSIPIPSGYLALPRHDVQAAPVKRALLRVGIAWAGNPDHARDAERSLALAALRPLLAVNGVQFYSLQRGGQERQLATLGWADEVPSHGPDFHDMEDTARFVETLDLVISVDSAIAHLAGALGVAVWVWLPAHADFRWLATGSDTPWYPSMRLLRQRTRGRWDDVIERTAEDLVTFRDAMRDGTTADDAACRQSAPDVKAAGSPDATDALPMKRGAVCAIPTGWLQVMPGLDAISHSLLMYGEYRTAQDDALLPLIQPGMTVLEAGCGVGAHTLGMAKRIGPGGHLLAYEASPIARRVLGQNLAGNSVTNVTLMRRSLAGTAECDRLSTGIEAETIDDLHLRSLDWIVAHESALLDWIEGADQTLWRCRPMLFIEAADEGQLDEIAERVAMRSYVCACIAVPLVRQRNFARRPVASTNDRVGWGLLAVPEECPVALPSETWRALPVGGGLDRRFRISPN